MVMLDYEEQRQRADKALRLNGFTSDFDNPLKVKAKPTLRIKRLSLGTNSGIKLKGASSIQNQLQKEREKAEKALRLIGG